MLQISEIIDAIENKLKQTGLPENPEGLYDPLRYMLTIGGKRIRPSLSLLASNLFTDDLENCYNTALAMELFHNFTLMHDDIMDEALMRRGMQSVHEKWNLNTAILSGDAMLVKAYELIATMSNENSMLAIRLFTDTALKVCEGQQLDMDFEKRKTVTPDEYFEMITRKTAVLLGCSLYCGALAGGSSVEDANLLYDAGVQAGISFQIKDDLLDLFGDATKLGKKIGGDIQQNKKTYLAAKTYQIAEEDDKYYLLELYAANYSDPSEKINRIRSLFEKYNIENVASAEMQFYFDNAVSLVNKVKVDKNKLEILLSYFNTIYSRNY